MVELLAFAPIHVSATVHRSSSQTVLRALLGLTFILSGDGAILAPDPEAPDEDDLAWLTRLDMPALGASCTARASSWRIKLPSGALEVEGAAEPQLSPVDWQNAMIEVGDQWLSVPQVHPLVSLTRSGTRKRETARLHRVDFARWRDRLRTFWRYERVFSGDATFADVMVEASEERAPMDSRESRPPPSSGEVTRITVEELHLGAAIDETISFDEARPSEPLPFTIPRQETLEIEAPRLEDPPTIAFVQDAPSRRTIGEVLAAQRPAMARSYPSSEPPRALDAPELGPTPKSARVDVLWWEPSAAKRARRQSNLAALLPTVRWASRGTEEVEERHRRDLEGLLRRATPLSLESALARTDDGDATEDREETGHLYVVAGNLVPELDESALLSATLGSVFSWRKHAASIEEVAAEAERVLAQGHLEHAPFLAANAAKEILRVVRSASGDEAAGEIDRSARLATLRARRFATRALFGDTYVRAHLADEASSSCVVYVSVLAAAALPLLLSLRVRLLARVLPPQEEGDSKNCLFSDVLGRET